ncbi:MAG: NAD-dependent epimerase/dehydratase family protein [Ignavibacteria bacterium]|nr:NAD-dependent epimerase/dehydratase family protein [Ignavibacteria bacterium]
MNVLVTGATGFVGSHVVDVLLERGLDVSFIARSTSKMRWLDSKPVRRVDGSLFDHTSLREAVSQADIVIHVAGLIAAKNEAEFLRGNRDATQNIVDAIRTYQPNLRRFVHISSLAVGGPSPSTAAPVDEHAPYNPITAYGRTKMAAEKVVIEAMQDINCTIVRPPTVYGPRDEATLTFFQVIKAGISPLIGFNEKSVSMVHIRDLARGIVDAALHERAIGQTYYIGSEKFYSWSEISTLTAAVMGRRRLSTIRVPHTVVLGIAGTVGFFGKLMGKPPVLDYEKGIDLIQQNWICSTDKAKREIGYRQEVSLNEGITETVVWYRAQGWL